jgi:phospholipid/cholesterol/gamma-HCH transport system substrate-binding protein
MRRLRPRGDVLTEAGPAAARVIALLVLIAVVTVVAVIVTRPYGTYEISARFDDTRGLIEGGEVTAGSQQVGSVKRVTLADDGLPVVTMKIDGDLELHRGASANIRLASNVGAVNRVVDLTVGDPAAPRLEDGDTLGPGSTDAPVNLDEAVSALDPPTRADAARLLAGLDAATKGRGRDLNRLLLHSSAALNETANVLGEVATDQRLLSSLVADTATVVEALASRPGDLGAAADRTAELLRTTGARRAELSRTMREIGPAFSSGTRTLRTLDDAIPELRDLLADAEPSVQRLRPVARRVPATAKALEPLLGSTRALVKAAPAQARHLTPVATDAVPVLEQLTPLLDKLNPLLDQLRVHTPEAVSFFSLGGDAVANYDVNGHLIRFIPRLIQFSSDTNPIGPFDSGPGSLTRPFDRAPGAIEGDPWTDYGSSFIGGAQPSWSYLP